MAKQAIQETVLLKPGEYRVQLLSIDEVESTFDKSGTQFSWAFTLVGGDHSGMELRGYSSTKLTKGLNISKAISWATALLGFEPAFWDIDELLGAEAMATIIPKAGKSDPNRKRNHIDSLAPIPRAQRGRGGGGGGR